MKRHLTFSAFFIFAPFVYSEVHRLMTTYTGLRGQKEPGIPEFFAVTSLDDQQIDYYDSNDGKLIAKQDWMKEYTSTDEWRKDTEIRKHVQQIYRNNMGRLMEIFNQTEGVHVYQRMYGCKWDDQTGDSYGFDEYGYDGEDFISLYLKEMRYITPANRSIIVNRWNNDRDELKFLQHYYNHECIRWMKDLLNSRKRVESRVSLICNEYPSAPVVCQATGFYTSNVILTWLKNGQKYHENVKIKDSLSNGDGTFNKSGVLYVPPDDWKKNKYVCVVEHMGNTIQKILTEDEIRSNTAPASWSFRHNTSSREYLGSLLACGFAAFVAFALIVYCKKKA